MYLQVSPAIHQNKQNELAKQTDNKHFTLSSQKQCIYLSIYIVLYQYLETEKDVKRNGERKIVTGVMAKLNKIKAAWLLWPCPHIERIICDRRASSKLKKCLIIVEVSCPDIDFIPGARSGGSKRASTLRRSSRVGAGGGKTGRK